MDWYRGGRILRTFVVSCFGIAFVMFLAAVGGYVGGIIVRNAMPGSLQGFWMFPGPLFLLGVFGFFDLLGRCFGLAVGLIILHVGHALLASQRLLQVRPPTLQAAILEPLAVGAPALFASTGGLMGVWIAGEVSAIFKVGWLLILGLGAVIGVLTGLGVGIIVRSLLHRLTRRPRHTHQR